MGYKVSCPSCGAENYDSDSACLSCGQSLRQQPVPAPPAPAPQPQAQPSPPPPTQPYAQPVAPPPTQPVATQPVAPATAVVAPWGGDWEFKVGIKSSAGRDLKGNFNCTLTPQGLHMRQRKKHDFLIPLGTPTRYLEKNRLSTYYGSEVIEVTVAKFGSYQDRLARDLTTFMNQQVAYLHPWSYTLPWYFYLLSILPIGIPILTLGGAIPGALGGALCYANFAIAQQEDWPVSHRVGLALLLTVTGYGLVLLLGLAATFARFR
ncbi:MAG: hypothetical protein PVH68_10480 [Armatimonadota bacterium]|jgi:hypothetical protein